MQREQYEKHLVEGTDFSLPRSQFIEDSVEAGANHDVSAADPIPESNKGYKLLQLMGWSGAGLGKHENGEHFDCIVSLHVWHCILHQVGGSVQSIDTQAGCLRSSTHVDDRLFSITAVASAAHRLDCAS